MNMLKHTIYSSLAIASLLVAACGGGKEPAEHPEEGPMESAGEEVDEAAEEAEETTEEAVEETGEELEEAGDEAEESTDNE